MHYISDGCRKPKESAATLKEGSRARPDRGSVGIATSRSDREAAPVPSSPAGTQALPADTIQKPKHKDRHKPGYMAAYLRKWRRGEVGNKYKKEMDR